MSDYNWCHGPECHTIHTVDRVRGSKGNKVLRTKKVTNRYKSMFGNGGASIWDFFCNHRCLMDFVSQHTQAIINIAPRREALETPIKVEKEKYESHRYKYNNGDYVRIPYQATRTTIKSVDNNDG